jgi:guanylate kinase
LIKRLMDGPDAAKLAFSVSHTTRKPREGEVDGIHYHFVSKEDFQAGITGVHVDWFRHCSDASMLMGGCASRWWYITDPCTHHTSACKQLLMVGTVWYTSSKQHTLPGTGHGFAAAAAYFHTCRTYCHRACAVLSFLLLYAAGCFLEHADVHNNLYGTSKDAVQETLSSGKAAVLDVDVQGARQIRKAGVPALLVFVAPPSLEELERRLRGRGTETPVSMERRIQNARDEISR